MEKILNVSAIKEGTVIDHIPSKAMFKVISILALQDCTDMITFGTNLESSAMGSKAIIKIENRFFKDEEINKIALIAPNAKLNLIRNYQVVEKRIVSVPDSVRDIVRCFNPKCITNNESVATQFQVINKKPIKLKCHYCEKITGEEEMIVK